MNYLNPIYTEKRECQDCYKCLRNCPVKAIKVEGGCATIIAELCILCGHCVEVCPNQAKKVRDDLPRARQLLSSNRMVIASLAPSFVSEFPEVRPSQLIAAIKRLGFMGVSETALGAQEVSGAVSQMLQRRPGEVLLSSACPTVVAYLQKHAPAATRHVTGLLSPLLTHCKMLRGQYGADIGIVFIGPCISKKTEADAHPDLLDVALTFEDLGRWLAQDRIDPAALPDDPSQSFIPDRAADGAWYPIDGGMIAGIKANCATNDHAFMTFSGIPAIQRALGDISELEKAGVAFLELLACEGGCVNGPKVAARCATAAKRCRVLKYGTYPSGQVPRQPVIPIEADYQVPAPAVIQCSDAQVRDALRQVGKFTAEDELDCGGCGYDSCRQFAHALINQKAERSMCVTYMRKLAHKKANALIQKMPSAVVIVNEALRIIECNVAFVRLLRPNAGVPADDLIPSLEGAALSTVAPFASLFSKVLKTGEDLVDRDLRHQQTILHLSIFSIEKHCIVGGIIQDITKPAVQKEQVIKRAQEVIQKNLATVQKIAYLLGENASESEITLNSIIDSFLPPKADEEGGDHDWRKLYRR